MISSNNKFWEGGQSIKCTLNQIMFNWQVDGWPNEVRPHLLEVNSSNIKYKVRGLCEALKSIMGGKGE